MPSREAWQEKKSAQILCGPFSASELPDFQAACVHFDQQWSRFLSATEQEFVKAIIYRTARIGPKYQTRRIPKTWFFDGHLGSTETGYAGCPSMLPISDKTFYKVRNDLCEYGIVIYHNSTYSIDYSVNAIHLSRNIKVQKRLLHQGRSGGQFKTIEGIIEWANHCANLLSLTSTVSRDQNLSRFCGAAKSSGIATPQNGKRGTNLVSLTGDPCPQSTSTHGESCSKNTQTKEVSRWKDRSKKRKRHNRLQGNTVANTHPLGVRHNTHVILSSDKSSDNNARDITDMGKTADEILASVNKSVDAQRSALDSKRRKRRTLADECYLFEKAWLRGQEGRGKFVQRIVGRDRRLLKEQIVQPSRGSDLNLEAVAEWCTTHWHAIGAQYFAKAKSYPEYPAFRWFVKCFATYLEAYEQREVLDEAGTRSTAQLVKRAALADKQDDETIETLQAAQREIAALKAELRDVSKQKKRTNRSRPLDDFDLELQSIVGNPKPKRKLKRKRK